MTDLAASKLSTARRTGKAPRHNQPRPTRLTQRATLPPLIHCRPPYLTITLKYLSQSPGIFITLLASWQQQASNRQHEAAAWLGAGVWNICRVTDNV